MLVLFHVEAIKVRTVREIIVVDRSAIQRSDRGAISDNATVNSRTVLTLLSHPIGNKFF